MYTPARLTCISSALAIVGMTLLFAGQPAAVPTAGAMRTYRAANRSIRIDHPSNWTPESHFSPDVETNVEFKPARYAIMTVRVNLQDSLVVDVLKSVSSENNGIAGMVPGGEALNPHQISPLAHLHATQATHLMNSVMEFPEFSDGETTTARIGGLDALVTDCSWTAPGLFGSRPMIGRRVTLLSGDHEVSVVYGCSKEMQRAILPIFDRMLSSMEIDAPGGGR